MKGLLSSVLCSIQDKPEILKSWMLLYNQSTVNMFYNPRLLNNIQIEYTVKKYDDAHKARAIQNTLGHPSNN